MPAYRNLLWIMIGLTLLGSSVAHGQTRMAYGPQHDQARASDSMLARPARLVVHDVSLVKALDRLAEAAGVVLAFSPSRVAVYDRPVTCECATAAVRDALNALLKRTPFRYLEARGQIVLYEQPPVQTELPPTLPELRFASRTGGLFDAGPTLEAPRVQEWTARGTIVDARTGSPIAGAQVVVDGTERGTLTDNRGRFVLTGLTGARVALRVIAIGYRTAMATATRDDPVVEVALTETAINLDEIVVTGTAGGVERRAVGNAIEKIDADALASAAVLDIGQGLQSRAPGVVVRTQHGLAGGGPRILIRGASSMAFDGNPLIYVDGVRVNNAASTGPAGDGGAGTPMAISRLNDIDPADIESIEIIKGPAAATLYGTEASDGVIQIITKSGRPGEMRFGLSVRQGAAWFDADERIAPGYWRDPATGEVVTYDPVAVEAERGTPVFRTGHLQGYGLDVSGGTADVQYYMGVNFDRDEGVVPENTAERFTARTKITATPSDALSVTGSLGLTRGTTSLYRAGYLQTIYWPMPQLKDAPQRGFFIAPPPEVIRETSDYWQDVDHVTGSVQISHRPTSWFSQRVVAGLDVTSEENVTLQTVVPPEYELFFGAGARRGSKTVDGRQREYTTIDYSASATADLTPRLRATTSLGGQYYRRFDAIDVVQGSEFPGRGVTTVSGAAIQTGSEYSVENTTVGIYVQEQLSWDDRFFLTTALRADDNSAFGGNFDLVTYPKVSASWVVHEEAFWNVPFVNALRIRGAYGQSGQQPAAFAALRTFTPITGEADEPAATPQALGNPDLGPERGQEIEIGFEAGLFDDRASVDLTYYHQRTKDAILQRQVAPSSGFPGMQYVNAGEVENKGIELQVTGRPVKTGSLAWELGLNLSTNANQILDLGLPGRDFIAVGFLPNRHQAGYPVGSYFSKRVVSADLDADGNPVNVLCDGGTGPSGVDPGGEPVSCNEAPPVFLGSSIPKIDGAVQSTLTLWNRLRLHALVDFRGGSKLFNANRLIRCWAFQNEDINAYPDRFPPEQVAECLFGLGAVGTSTVEDAGFTKLREIALSYTLGERWARMMGAGRAVVAVAARNLHTWTDYRGMDPEVFTTSNWLGSSHDEAVLPLPLQVTTTVNLTF